MRRALVVGVAVLLASCRPGADAREPDSVAPAVIELDVSTAQAQMKDGSLTSARLTAAYLERIAAIDVAGPRLSAVIELNPRARAEAEALDRERAAGRVRGPLHGIPVLIKDNIDVVGMANSAGTVLLATHRPRADAPLVARLRAAGAVILGKANLSEWANLRSLRAVSGWSSRGGQTRNPYVLDRNACGSSSGTGAAIAASLAAVGVGTETDGSIMCPSAVNGLVGLKPTVGLVSREGIIPISATQDTAGPMTRTVTEAALVLAALAEGEPRDYVKGLSIDALQGKRIGVLRQAMGYHPDVDALTEAAVATLVARGAEVVDPIEIATWNKWDEVALDVLLFEFKDGLNRYLKDSRAPVSSLADVIAWNREHAVVVMPWFGQELFEQAQAKGSLDSPEYVAARETARKLAWDEGLGAALKQHKLDAVVAPTTGPAWPIDPVLGDRFTGSGTSMAAIAGTPSLTVPMGEIHGLPVGLAFLGKPNGEAELLALGFAFEQETRARKRPTYRPTIAPGR
ncbi:amidase [Nannocystis bainbridge]|uniref:Amidase n=1 Tax=Nannocystis bainbridge TaxID=2995303 RepID=A0ABT5DVE0_9BACT|nr:amidase [Nannocystis bainbridge]MDC0716673.1 amidase [Nannocystis bainbridge]